MNVLFKRPGKLHPGQLSLLWSGISLSVRIAHREIHPELRVFERMCIIGQHRWNHHVVLAIQLESIVAISNARKLAKAGVDYVAFGPTDLTFSLESHPEYPLQTVDDCMRNVAEQLKGSGIRLGMAVMTEPEARDKYLEMGITVFQEAPRP
jgi:hypothetical protein